MHELLLYGQVPASRHDQVLKILAGVAAVQPRRILQRCIVYKPQREPEEPGSNARRGGTQNVVVKQAKQTTVAAALYYTKLVQRLDEDDFGNGEGLPKADGKVLSANVKDGEGPKWSMRWEDIPDTGDRGVSMRFTNTTDLVSGDPHAQMIAAGPNRYAILS
jgi:mediator of RNA polymerase II transcription subunit 18